MNNITDKLTKEDILKAKELLKNPIPPRLGFVCPNCNEYVGFELSNPEKHKENCILKDKL